MFVVKEFCCGCSLRHGAITAAVLQALESSVLLTAGVRYLNFAQYGTEISLPNNQNEYKMMQNDEHLDDADKRILTTYGSLILAIGLISFVIFIFLVIGIIKVIATFIIPWLIVCMIEIFMFTVSVVLLIIWNHPFFSGLVTVVFHIYLWVVVLNYYHELHDGLHPLKSPEEIKV